MITKIRLRKDATVLAEDGTKVGSLERVVVNTETNVITDVVVRTGGLLGYEDKLVPVELIVETADDKILLHENAGTLNGFPPLEERHLVDAHGKQGRVPSSGVMPPVLGGAMVGTPLMPVSNQAVTQLEQNIPEGTIAMKLGAAVNSADEKSIGNLECVIAEPFMDQITHLVVSRGLLVKETNFIPIHWVLRMGEDVVHLRVNRKSIEEATKTPVGGK